MLIANLCVPDVDELTYAQWTNLVNIKIGYVGRYETKLAIDGKLMIYYLVKFTILSP